MFPEQNMVIQPADGKWIVTYSGIVWWQCLPFCHHYWKPLCPENWGGEGVIQGWLQVKWQSLLDFDSTHSDSDKVCFIQCRVQPVTAEVLQLKIPSTLPHQLINSLSNDPDSIICISMIFAVRGPTSSDIIEIQLLILTGCLKVGRRHPLSKYVIPLQFLSDITL